MIAAALLLASRAVAQEVPPPAASEAPDEAAPKAPGEAKAPGEEELMKAWVLAMPPSERGCWDAMVALGPSDAVDTLRQAKENDAANPARPVGAPNSLFACRYLANQVSVPDGGPDPALEAAMVEYRRYVLEPRTTSPAAAGVAGQVEAAPAAQPEGDAGAVLAVTSTPEGTQGIGAITINPLGLVQTGDATAVLGRTLDVTLLVPVSGSGTVGSSSLGYAGVRVRANVVTPFDRKALPELLAKLDEVEASVTERNALLGASGDRWEAVLAAAPDPLGCVRAANAGDVERAAIACGQAPPDPTELLRAEEENRRLVKAASEALDASYFGLDLRYDHGDPTFSGVPAKEGDALTALVGFGSALAGGSAQLRGNGGMHSFVPLDASLEQAFSVQGALAFHLATTTDDPAREVTADLGVQGRYGGDLPDDLEVVAGDTNFLDAVLGLSIPAANGTRLAVGYRVPIVDELGTRPPALTLTGDWSALPSFP